MTKPAFTVIIGLICRLAVCGTLMVSPMASAQALSLDGEWQFAVDSSAAFSIDNVRKHASWRTAQVPLSWQAQFTDLRDYQGVAWYRKTLMLPRLKADETVLLEFGAVDYVAEVFVNGHGVGKHEGGYTPFAFDVGQFVNAGENEVIVRVMDPEPTATGTEGISYWQIPHGKQNWYVQTSGLWQSVLLHLKPRRHIAQVHVTAGADGKFSVHVKLRSDENKKSREQLTLRIFDSERRLAFETAKRISSSDEQAHLESAIPNPKLWSFSSPHLYTAEISLNESHRVSERFGFRAIEARDKLLYLNGEPFYLMAALDQDFYPETIYTSPSEEYLRDEMLKAKRLGLNMLRCHLKVPDPRYLKVADEVGLLVWYEIPNWDVFTSAAARRGEETLEAMLDRDWNHPSLVIISLINESWGVDLKQPDQRQWLLSAFDRAKQRATGRLIVDNSACWGNFHMKTDLNDYHTYWATPENRHRFDQTISDFAQRPKWLFSEFGDAQETGKEPLLLSEFGNWGLPRLAEEMPWWFARDFGGRQVTLPQGVQQRFKDFHYDEIFESYNQLAEESQRAQFVALKYEIEQIRLKPEIQGYVITEFTDINWECNGLLDMWRNVKIYADDLANIQQQDVIIPRPVKYNYWDDETVEIELWLSHYSAVEVAPARLRWQASFGATGELAIPPIARTEIKSIASLRLGLPEVTSPQRVRLQFQLTTAAGKLLTQNTVEVLVYPRPAAPAAIRLHDPNKTFGAFAQAAHAAGFLPKKPSAQSAALVTNVLDDELLQRLRKGESAICLIDSTTKLPAAFPFVLTSRAAEWYDGNWASNLNWLRNNRPPFRDLGVGRFLGFEAEHVAPRTVITGLAAASFSDALAGMYVGWLHLNSASVLQMKVGQGKLLLCTLRLAEALGHDPFAALLLNALVKYSLSPHCAPTTTPARVND